MEQYSFQTNAHTQLSKKGKTLNKPMNKDTKWMNEQMEQTNKEKNDLCNEWIFWDLTQNLCTVIFNVNRNYIEILN